MTSEFIDDDAGYFGWLTAHSEGFLVNTYRKPSASYLVLHRAGCSHIQRWEGRTSTAGQYRKVCSDSEQELHDWAASIGGTLTRCRSCQP